MSQPHMVHFTEGGPWHGHCDQLYVTEWISELKHLLGGDNPKAEAISVGLTVGVSFGDEHG